MSNESEVSLQNANPVIYDVSSKKAVKESYEYIDENSTDAVDSEEIFEHIRYINDPEHPLSLEQLNIVNISNVKVNDSHRTVEVLFTPTIPHCSMATLIGLCIRVKLLRSISPRFKVTVKIYPGTHLSEDAVNKQLNDKERIAAALENKHLLDVVNKCILFTEQ